MGAPTPALLLLLLLLALLASPELARIAPHLHLVPMDVRQAAVWILTDDATRETFWKYDRPRIDDREVLEAVALLELAGIDLEDRRIRAFVPAP